MLTARSGGFQAEVVVVSNFEELEEQGRSGRLRGNMVLIDFPWEGYGRSVHYRCTAGPSDAKAEVAPPC